MCVCVCTCPQPLLCTSNYISHVSLFLFLFLRSNKQCAVMIVSAEKKHCNDRTFILKCVQRCLRTHRVKKICMKIQLTQPCQGLFCWPSKGNAWYHQKKKKIFLNYFSCRDESKKKMKKKKKSCLFNSLKHTRAYSPKKLYITKSSLVASVRRTSPGRRLLGPGRLDDQRTTRRGVSGQRGASGQHTTRQRTSRRGASGQRTTRRGVSGQRITRRGVSGQHTTRQRTSRRGASGQRTTRRGVSGQRITRRGVSGQPPTRHTPRSVRLAHHTAWSVRLAHHTAWSVRLAHHRLAHHTPRSVRLLPLSSSQSPFQNETKVIVLDIYSE